MKTERRESEVGQSMASATFTVCSVYSGWLNDCVDMRNDREVCVAVVKPIFYFTSGRMLNPEV